MLGNAPPLEHVLWYNIHPHLTSIFKNVAHKKKKRVQLIHKEITNQNSFIYKNKVFKINYENIFKINNKILSNFQIFITYEKYPFISSVLENIQNVTFF